MLPSRRILALGWCAFALAQAPTFQSKVNVVLVPVVVRDSHGRPVGSLTKDDFQLFDRNKRQTIVSFSAVDRAREPMQTAPSNVSRQTASAGVRETAPKRYLIYLFDDVNIRFAAMANVREAAVRHFRNHLAEGDRAAIYAVSGNPNLDFTSDREKLEGAVSKLRWRADFRSPGFQCPDVSYYVADLVAVKADVQALAALTNHTVDCAHVPPELAQEIAKAAANRELIIGAQNTATALKALKAAIQRLSGMPGQRLVVLASPGFFAQTPQAIRATAEVLDLAAKSNVVVSGLSARGVLVAEEEEDVTRRANPGRKAPPGASSAGQLWMHYQRESAREDGDAMKDLAEGTGGMFFRNNNDLRIGFERVSAAPEFSYVLGFSPAELKADGSFHALKVRLSRVKGVSLEARRGYYAVASGAPANETAGNISEAVFSHGEQADIPVVLQTGYSKPIAGDDAKILLVAKIDLTPLRDSGGEPLFAIAAVFDEDGNYVTGAAETANVVNDPSVTLRWSFDVKRGAYGVRLVVRGPGGKSMTMLNRVVKVL